MAAGRKAWPDQVKHLIDLVDAADDAHMQDVQRKFLSVLKPRCTTMFKLYVLPQATETKKHVQLRFLCYMFRWAQGICSQV